MEDFGPETCRTYPGKVVTINEMALGKTPIDEKKYRIDFLKDANVGDLVVVHRDFVIERIGKKVAGRMLDIKGMSFK